MSRNTRKVSGAQIIVLNKTDPEEMANPTGPKKRSASLGHAFGPLEDNWSLQGQRIFQKGS